MASINNKIRGKKLFKQGSSGTFASKGGDGEITVSKEISDELASLDDISMLFNDDGLFQTNKFLLKQIEDLRTDVEELHAFIKDAFGSDSSSASSKGAKGDKGDTGSAGSAGAKGDKGNTGSQGAQGATGPAGSNASVSGFTGSQSFVVDKKGGTVSLTFEDGLVNGIKT
tara:strand:+ start:1086 stop:1595 length:510 start_codon:yes stop_codon:yes gene_type:complete